MDNMVNDNEKAGGGGLFNPLSKESYTVEVLDFKKEDYDKNVCIICMDKRADTVFYPCGHQCVCQPCGETFRKVARHQVCPVCRNRIKDIIKVYK